MNVYKYENYVDILKNALENGEAKWGTQSRLAKAAGCQRSYLSQVLKGKAVLTQDQGIGIAEYLGMDAESLHYFLLLISLARASTVKLKDFYRQKLKEIRLDRENLAKRFQASSLSDLDKQAIYYSSWLHSAVHIHSGINDGQTPSTIAHRLGVDKDHVTVVLGELETIGLVEEFRRGHWRNTKSSLHLPAGSPMTPVNHMNWRQRAVLDSSMKRPNSLHYTAVMSILKKDIPTLKALILETLDKSRAIVKSSGKEEVVVMCCDLFEA